jgi:hypothetical protein
LIWLQSQSIKVQSPVENRDEKAAGPGAFRRVPPEVPSTGMPKLKIRRLAYFEFKKTTTKERIIMPNNIT